MERYLFGRMLYIWAVKGWYRQISRDIYLPHGWFLFLVVHGQWGFPVAHCLTGSDLSAHLFHFGLHVSVLPEGHLGWTPPGHTFSSLAQRLNSRSATAKARRADRVKMINLIMMMVLLLLLSLPPSFCP